MLALSTCRAQVYDGSKADWTEEDACQPVNAYGSSKLEAEHFLRVSAPLEPFHTAPADTGAYLSRPLPDLKTQPA